MDRFSRSPEAFRIPNKKAETIAKILVEQIVCRYGCPRTLLSDRGGEFLNELADETYKLLNIKKLNTSGYRPQTNGLVEKFNHTLIQAISQYVSSNQHDWDEFLNYACFQYRSIKNDTTKESPYYLLFMREMKMPLDIAYDLNSETELPVNDLNKYIKEMKRRMTKAKEIFDQQLVSIEEEKRKFNDHIIKHQRFEVCDVVLILKRYVPKRHVKKLSHLWRGPYIVTQKINNGINYQVELLKDGKDSHVVHGSNMKIYSEPHTTHLDKTLKRLKDRERINTNNNGQEYEVEKVLEKEYKNGKSFYLVKWKNFDENHNTWEPLRHLIHCKNLIQKFESEKCLQKLCK